MSHSSRSHRLRFDRHTHPRAATGAQTRAGVGWSPCHGTDATAGPSRRCRPRGAIRAELLAEVRRLQIRAKRQDVALATDAIVTLRRGVDALRAHNRELLLEATRLRAAREGKRARA